MFSTSRKNILALQSTGGHDQLHGYVGLVSRGGTPNRYLSRRVGPAQLHIKKLMYTTFLRTNHDELFGTHEDTMNFLRTHHDHIQTMKKLKLPRELANRHSTIDRGRAAGAERPTWEKMSPKNYIGVIFSLCRQQSRGRRDVSG